MSKRLVLILLVSITATLSSTAQIFKRKTARRKDIPPQAILVEIFTNSRMEKYYTQTNNQAKLSQLKIDRDSVRDRIVMDFKDNFTYCPVYYFIDTNMRKVLAKDFNDVLLDSSLTPIKNVYLSPAAPYQIVFFSSPVPDVGATANPSGNNDPYDGAYVIARKRKRLIVQDETGKNINTPLPNGANNIKGGTLKKTWAEYKYNSPLLDIYYRPYAKFLSNKMRVYYGPYPY